MNYPILAWRFPTTNTWYGILQQTKKEIKMGSTYRFNFDLPDMELNNIFSSRKEGEWVRKV
jgi:hypothetical protein